MKIGCRIAALLAFCVAILDPGYALAQRDTFPSRTITMILPFAPGGSTDGLARAVAENISQTLKVPVIVENKAGAGGAIGMTSLANAKPDGYTIGFTVGSTLSVLPFMTKTTPYDPLNGFVPIIQLGSFGVIIVGGPALQQRSFKEFLAAGQKAPNSITLGLASTFGRLMNAMIADTTGARFLEVPFPGTSPAQIALIGGNIQAAVDQVTTTAELIEAKKIFGLAVTSKDRSPRLPDVPAIGEFIPGFELVSWFGLLAPKGTPPEMVETLHRALAMSLQDAKVKEALRAADMSTIGNTPAEFADALKAEVARNRMIIEKYKLADQ